MHIPKSGFHGSTPGFHGDFTVPNLDVVIFVICFHFLPDFCVYCVTLVELVVVVLVVLVLVLVVVLLVVSVVELVVELVVVLVVVLLVVYIYIYIYIYIFVGIEYDAQVLLGRIARGGSLVDARVLQARSGPSWRDTMLAYNVRHKIPAPCRDNRNMEKTGCG
jgi:hypothetical protein